MSLDMVPYQFPEFYPLSSHYDGRNHFRIEAPDLSLPQIATPDRTRAGAHNVSTGTNKLSHDTIGIRIDVRKRIAEGSYPKGTFAGRYVAY